jgi:hypothetical protein
MAVFVTWHGAGQWVVELVGAECHGGDIAYLTLHTMSRHPFPFVSVM